MEKGVDFGGTSFALPLGVQEIAIGVVMIVILMYRPSGLTRNREVVWPSSKLSAAGSATAAADGKTA
jgi:branched-chain amino acid transport system permease protein